MSNIRLILIFILANSLHGQTKVFNETFDNNSNKWWTGTNEFYEGKIEKGYYELYYKAKEKPEKNVLISYNQLNVFAGWEVEMRIKVIELPGNQNSYGVAIGEKDFGNSHYFSVSPNLKRSWWFENKLYAHKVLHVEPLPLNIFDKDDENSGTKITLKHKKDRIFLYVNDVFLNHIAEPETWFGTGVGLYINVGTCVKVDYIKIISN